ncbi:FkbM family methyltransferase [Pleurocapsales cyanobacterium LEGE 10410]|nr:FkbM family methyltransferase [Pleurocapsales cyanobacterium LEGE 10410]
MPNLKQIIKNLATELGWEIRRYHPAVSEIPRMYQSLAYHQIDLVLDVGANVGQYAMLLRKLGYAGKIVSFEPLSSAYSRLKTISDKDSLWEVAPRTAIGNENNEIEINISANSQSSSVLGILDSHLKAASNSAYVGSETVKLSRLDTVAQGYLDNASSVFLKIDVQGFEKQVLEGATKILPQIKGIEIELSLVPLYQGQPLFQEMLDLLDGLGYELYAVIPGLADPKTGRLLQMDGIFFRP